MLKYIEAHMESIPADESDSASYIYKKLLEIPKHPKDEKPNPSFEEWLQGWIFCHSEECLPPQFNQLMQGYWSLFQLAPWKGCGYQKITPEVPAFADFNRSDIFIPLNLKGEMRKPERYTLHYPYSKNLPNNFRDQNLIYKSLQHNKVYTENETAESIESKSRAPQIAGAISHPIRMLTLLDSFRHNLGKLSENYSSKNHYWISNILFSPDGLFLL